MKFSKKSEYALRALIELTVQYGQPHLQRHEIAKRQQIPIEFLEQILLTLKNAGLLGSRRGVTGGYNPIKPPPDNTLRPGNPNLDGPPPPPRPGRKTPPPKSSDRPSTDEKSSPI